MAAGKPIAYETPELLDNAVSDYFMNCVENKSKPTISGLAYYLGFESRQSFYDYEKREEYSYTIKRARLRIEQHYEEHLLNPGIATGAIFALKNFGWRDKSELEHSGRFTINWSENKSYGSDDKTD